MPYIKLCVLFLLGTSSLFGQQTLGLFQNSPSSFNGYTLFAQNASQQTYLIDNCGNEVHTWNSNSDPGLSVYLLENGNLLRTAKVSSNFSSGGSGGGMELLDWDSNVLWSYDYSSVNYHQHHDVECLPNGNILVLAWEVKNVGHATQAGRDPSNTFINGIWPEHIVELEPIGNNGANIVWEWHLWDHLVQDFDATKDNFGVVADHPELFDINYNTSSNTSDIIHANSVDYNVELDQILISSRSLGEIWVIDHSTTTAEAASHTGGNSGRGGDFLYRWGNPQVYDRGTLADQQFFGQHNAHWIEEGLPDAGKIMVFNNGNGRPGGNHISVDIIDPPIDVNGNYSLATNQAFEPSSLFWTYSNPNLFANSVSGAHRLPNGNTMVCVGPSGYFIEVTQDDEIVWEYQNPISNSGPLTQGNNPMAVNTFRATRLAPDYAGLIGQDLTPMAPLEQNPLPSDCIIYDRLDLVINEIDAMGRIEIKNSGDKEINISSFWLVNENNAVQLRQASFICGDTILLPNEIIVINNFLNVTNIEGELALYSTITFESSSAMADYVQWGSAGHQHSAIAIDKGIWEESDFVPAFDLNQSIEYIPLDEGSPSWIIQENSSICIENTSILNVCSINAINVSTISQSLYHAKIDLQSNATVNGLNTAFKAGMTVCLDVGFEVQLGTEFEAEVEECTTCF